MQCKLAFLSITNNLVIVCFQIWESSPWQIWIAWLHSQISNYFEKFTWNNEFSFTDLCRFYGLTIIRFVKYTLVHAIIHVASLMKRSKSIPQFSTWIKLCPFVFNKKSTTDLAVFEIWKKLVKCQKWWKYCWNIDRVTIIKKMLLFHFISFYDDILNGTLLILAYSV